ncbi:MAG: hypothetical protein IPH93_16430 [Saprospiraceae bacterium]|nr:hypothetical protein [Saprospiraceae bacterium]
MAQTISWLLDIKNLVINTIKVFIHYKDSFDTDTTQNIDIPVEATCLAYTDPNSGKLLFYSNSCKLYDPNGRIVLGSELLNEGHLANDVCDKYGYLMDYSILQSKHQEVQTRCSLST